MRNQGGILPRLSLLALEALNQSSLLPTDVGTGSPVDEQVKVIARATGVLS